MRFLALTTITTAGLLVLTSCENESPPQEEASNESVQYIDPNKIQFSPIIHEKLSDDQMARIKAIHGVFGEFDGQSLEQWVEDFRRDLDPEPNIVVWEQMVVAYEGYISSQDNLSKGQKLDVYRLILFRSMVPENEVLEQLKTETMTQEEARKVLSHYRWEAKPIEVIQVDE